MELVCIAVDFSTLTGNAFSHVVWICHLHRVRFLFQHTPEKEVKGRKV